MSTTATTTDTKTIITLKGSVAVVSEFFFTAINSILYQRGIYTPETFKRESKYGLTVLTTTDEGLLTYLNSIMEQMENWLLNGKVQRLVVVVTGVDSGETLERWQFNVRVEGGGGGGDENAVIGNGQDVDGNRNVGENQHNSVVNNDDDDKLKAKNGAGSKNGKSLKEIHNEIQAIIRQITASVSFKFVLWST
jgi:mitotic spindle assembly checkpoint protein MAD2